MKLIISLAVAHFLHFSTFAISSGADKRRMQDLSSDLAKKARIRGWAYFKCSNHKIQDGIPKIVGLLEQVFASVAAHEYHHDGV